MIGLIENIDYEHECPGKYFRSENLQGLEAFMYVRGCRLSNSLWNFWMTEKLASTAISFVKIIVAQLSKYLVYLNLFN